MGTPALVGIAEGDGDFRAVYVGYDGYPESLGVKLLDLVRDLDGDLERVWAFVSSVPEGWRSAFHEAYEVGDNREFFDTGRDDCLLRRDDEFTKMQIACRYIFDLKARTMDVICNRKQGWELEGRAHFDSEGNVTFEQPVELATDWRNRRRRVVPGDPPEGTVKVLRAILSRRFPLQTTTTMLNLLPPDFRFELTDDGLVAALTLFVSVPDPRAPSGMSLTDIVEHSTYVLLAKRALSETARCEHALNAAIDAIERRANRAGKIAFPSPHVFSDLLPFDLLDLDLDGEALSAAIQARVESCFS